MMTGCGTMPGYRQHKKDGTRPCKQCRNVRAGYTSHLKLYGPRPKNGLPEVITDVVGTYEPVALSEVPALVAQVRAGVKPESVRRVTYRLLDAGTLGRVYGRLVTL